MLDQARKVIIEKRKLREDEASLLTEESRKFLHLGLIKRKLWHKFDFLYVATERNNLVGVCVVTHLKNWFKIGPVIILEKYQRQEYGRLLLANVVDKYKQTNIYIGSSNPAILKITEGLGFKKVNSFISLPKEIKIYLILYFFGRLDLEYILDSTKKKLKNKNKYYYFLKYSS